MDEPRILTASDLAIDTVAMTVEQGARPVNLTRTEYDLLLYMVQNAGRPLSKDELLEKVWPGKNRVSENTVEVYIKHLRHKLPRPDVIKTRRGFGYVIESGAAR